METLSLFKTYWKEKLNAYLHLSPPYLVFSLIPATTSINRFSEDKFA